jgi:uncharacterized protein
MTAVEPARDRHPLADADGRPFWDALAEGRLLVPNCLSCGRSFFPPMPSCPRCAATTLALEESPGIGRVYSWVTVRIALDPAFTDDVPYSVVAVDLAEGARILGRFVGNSTLLEPGLAVRIAPYRMDGLTVPGFVPAQ